MTHRYLATLALLICAASAHADQSWNFQSYNQDGSKGQLGYITLSGDQDGRGSLRFYVSNMSACFKGSIPATIENTETEKVIVISPAMGGCSSIRFTIKKDGTGGSTEHREGDGPWTPYANGDQLLTAR